jgi:hypothetical protein
MKLIIGLTALLVTLGVSAAEQSDKQVSGDYTVQFRSFVVGC